MKAALVRTSEGNNIWKSKIASYLDISYSPATIFLTLGSPWTTAIIETLNTRAFILHFCDGIFYIILASPTTDIHFKKVWEVYTNCSNHEISLDRHFRSSSADSNDVDRAQECTVLAIYVAKWHAAPWKFLRKMDFGQPKLNERT